MESDVSGWVERIDRWTDYFAFREPVLTDSRVDRYYLWLLAAVVAICMLVLFARMPARILDPHFFAEDGANFFQDAYNLGALRSMVTPYAGYYHLIPRTVASASLRLPLAQAPLFFSLTALVIASLSLSWFFLPHFRPLVRSDWIRLGVVGLCVLSPNIEGVMVIAYIQWFVAVWCVFVTLMRPPRRLWLQWVIAIVYIIVTATAPIVIVLVPIWLLRLWRARPYQRVWIGCILLAQVVLIGATLRIPQETPAVTPFHMLVVDVFRAFTYKVVGVTLIGAEGTSWLFAQFGWPGINLLAGGAVLGLFLLVVQQRHNRRILFLSLLLGYLVLVITMVYVHRASTYGFAFAHATDFVSRWHSRYFLLGSLGLYLLCALHADNLLLQSGQRQVRALLVALWLLVVVGYAGTDRMPYTGRGDWTQHSVWLDRVLHTPQTLLSGATLQARTAGLEQGDPANGNFTLFLPVVTASKPDTTGQYPISIPIEPHPWCLRLQYRAKMSDRIVFSNQFTLVRAEVSVQSSHLVVDLSWTISQQQAGKAQTIWFELVDQEARSLMIQPEVLATPKEDICFPRLFATRHVLPVPLDLPGGSYDFLVSLTELDAPLDSATDSAHFPAVVQIDP